MIGRLPFRPLLPSIIYERVGVLLWGGGLPRKLIIFLELRVCETILNCC